MRRAKERMAALEDSFPDRQPATAPRKRRDFSLMFAGIEESSRRRKRWLATATAAQLEARLRRIDNVDEAGRRRDDRRIREGHQWAGVFAGLTGEIADSDREEIANRLFADARIEIIHPDCGSL